MTINIQEDNLNFEFEFNAIKFDESKYYQDSFKRITNGIKAVDILAIDGCIGYLIEIKDYTHPNTCDMPLIDLIEAVIGKVMGTLSAILPMKNNATCSEEKNIANLFSQTNQIKIFLHIELPPLTSELGLSRWRLSNIQMKLKRRLNAIDINPKVVSITNMINCPWTVSMVQN